MKFCPDCGSLLRSRGDDGSCVFFCSCGFLDNSSSGELVKEIVVHKDVIVPVSDVNPLASESHVCKKCGFGRALLVEPEIVVRETAGCCEADRPGYICGRCGFKEFL